MSQEEIDKKIHEAIELSTKRFISDELRDEFNSWQLISYIDYEVRSMVYELKAQLKENYIRREKQWIISQN